MQLLTSMLTALALLISATGCAKAELTDPYEILDRHYKATGVADTTRVWKSTYEEGVCIHDSLGTLGTFKGWNKWPAFARVEGFFADFIYISGDDGAHEWMHDTSGEVTIMQDAETLRQREVDLWLAHFEHLRRDSKVVSVFLDGLEEVNGSTCYVIRISDTLAQSVELMYIDTSSFYEIVSVSMGLGGESRAYYSDFRQVDGIIHAFRVKRFFPDGESLNYVTTELIVNPPLHDSIFAPSADTLADMEFD